MVSGSSIIIGLGGVVGGAAVGGGYLFFKGYLQQAGANAANKTPVVKADTVNRRKKQGNQNIVDKLEKLREEKKEIRREKQTEIEEFKNELSDYERIIESIQDESVARKRLIENYWKPFHALGSVEILFFSYILA